jgi:hypothetical protein
LLCHSVLFLEVRNLCKYITWQFYSLNALFKSHHCEFNSFKLFFLLEIVTYVLLFLVRNPEVPISFPISFCPYKEFPKFSLNPAGKFYNKALKKKLPNSIFVFLTLWSTKLI